MSQLDPPSSLVGLHHGEHHSSTLYSELEGLDSYSTVKTRDDANQMRVISLFVYSSRLRTLSSFTEGVHYHPTLWQPLGPIP